MTTLSFLVLSCGAPTASHLLAYFASSLPNINTLKLYFYTTAPVLPCRCGQIQRRCVSMRADAVDAVISHTETKLLSSSTQPFKYKKEATKTKKPSVPL